MFGTQEKAEAESTRPGSEEQVPLYEEFIYCCGAATQVLKCGPWKDLLETESKTLPRLLFLIIPVPYYPVGQIETSCVYRNLLTKLDQWSGYLSVLSPTVANTSCLRKSMTASTKIVLYWYNCTGIVTAVQFLCAEELQVVFYDSIHTYPYCVRRYRNINISPADHAGFLQQMLSCVEHTPAVGSAESMGRGGCAVTFRSSCRKFDAYRLIARAMQEMGHERDAQQCRAKIKELKLLYQKAREANHHCDAAQKTYRFYKKLDAILGSDPTSTPKSPVDTSGGLEAVTSRLNPLMTKWWMKVKLEDNVEQTAGSSVISCALPRVTSFIAGGN
ncbi:UPF0554 protein C2orf43 like protein [Chelonia mydas]|uniref:UPF0554 protein C2orf43 like protein n=1 Tax=Chelonia mydas TaxID=8469 RepID=M7B229_CHEMY|nr:UPF0554 protein C2orf43 like protein [Chelonia mydas]